MTRFQSMLAGTVLLAALLAGGQAHASVVESWDSGAWGAGWSNPGAGTVTSAAAHDGSYGVSLADGSWTTNSTVTAAVGDAISLWVQPTARSSGRLYLGIGAGASGTDSLVVATNTRQLIFQNNAGYNYDDVASANQRYRDGAWYRIEIDWVSTTELVGKLFGADGTLLNSVTQTSSIETPGSGLALRGFGGWNADTLSVSSLTPSVPEPATGAILLVGLAGLVLARRRTQRGGASAA